MIFCLGTSEFMIAGLLEPISADLGVSIPEAGHLISAYALGVCFGAPLTVLVARTRPLKHILLVLAGLIAWAVMHFLFAAPEEETDDAYVAGDVVAITARIARS